MGPLSPLPLACGNAPGADWGAGVDSCIGSAVSSLGEPILAVRSALKRLNSSGGRLSGCDSSESFLRKAKDVLARGLFNFFSFSLRSRTNDERFFFSGDDWADLDLCASAESTDGRVGDSRASSSGCGVADAFEDFLRVKRDGIEKRHGHPERLSVREWPAWCAGSRRRGNRS